MAVTLCTLVLFLAFTFLFSQVQGGTYYTGDEEALKNISLSAEKRLTRFLLERYKLAGKEGRPVYDSTTTVPIKFSLGLIQLNLNEKEKVFTTSMWTRMYWQDQYLTWNASQYDGIEKLRFDDDQIWIPDVMLVNTADVKTERRKVYITVQNTGDVQWIPHQIFSSSCSIEVRDFPFDSQVCHMWFGSWTHNNGEMNLTFHEKGGLDLSTFQEDFKEISAWEIYDTDIQRVEQPPGPQGFTALTYEFKLRRKLSFTCYILTMPCIFLATLTLVVFCLPPERPDRTGLAMSLFSSFLLLLLILVEAAPPTASSVPKLGLYYCFNMVLIMLSIFLSSMVVNINKQGERRNMPPKIVKVIFLKILSRVLCVSDVCHRRAPEASHSEKTPPSRDHYDDQSTKLLTCNNHTEHSPNFLFRPGDKSQLSIDINQDYRAGERYDLGASLYLLQRSVNEVRMQLDRIASSVCGKKEQTALQSEYTSQWKQLSRVLDRLFFILYLIAVVTSLFTLFPRPSHFL